MSYLKHLVIAASVLLSFMLTSCTNDVEKTNDEQDLVVQERSLSDDLFKNVIITNKPNDVMSITTAKAELKAGQAITVKGRIGGRVDPFITGRAAMILADSEALTACDAKADDHCSTPWDFCCEETAAVANATAFVQIMGDDGRVLGHELRGIGGLQAGSYVIVQGTIDDQPTGDNLVVNAQHIYLDAVNHGAVHKP